MRFNVLDLVFPRFCAACDAVVKRRSSYICWDCFSSIDILTNPICSVCGDPADGMIDHEYKCSWCVNRKPHFDKARSAARHRGLIRDTLHKFKYNNAMHLMNDFAELLVSCVTTHYSKYDFDAVTAVPLDVHRQRKRSYNQSLLLAKKVAKVLGVVCASHCLTRAAGMQPQVGLNARQRKSNVKGAFSTRDVAWIKGRSFLLIDDVMTTGATVNEVSKVLKSAGAGSVCVATVARG